MEINEKLAGYQALLEGAAYVPSGSGYLVLAGPDRVDFLQRQTTNDVKLLSETRAVLTVLTSPTARILDVLWLLPDEDRIAIMTAPQRGAATAAFLRGKIFFMDKVTLEDHSANFAQYELDGTRIDEALVRLGLRLPATDDIVSGEIDGAKVRLIGQRGLFGAGARMIVTATDIAKVEAALHEVDIIRASQGAYDIVRVEAGLVGINELTEDFTPLEVTLNHAVSDSKGCYTGQEIIARQITYDKVTRSLAGIKLDVAVSVGSFVALDGRNVGVVTSAVESPRFGAIALAVIKRPHHEANTDVTIDGTAGRVTSLPFGN